MKKMTMIVAGMIFLAWKPTFADEMKMDKMEQPVKATPAPKQKKKMTKKDNKQAMYQCPMKCSPPQNKPGNCSVCGMKLEKMK